MIIFTMSWAKPHEINGKKGALLLLYIQPGASKTTVRGLFQDRLKLSVQAPPVEGAANEAVIRFLSDILDISRKSIHLISGETSRQKNIWIEGDAEMIQIRLSQAL